MIASLSRGKWLAFAAVAVGAANSSEARAQVRELCNQPVTYSISAPSSDLSEQARKFLGVWIGNKRKTGQCVALVVERARPDGSVDVIYVRGYDLGRAASAANALPATFPLKGTLAASGTMVIQVPDQGRWEVKLAGPTEATGDWNASWTRDVVTFKLLQ
jgi:hypothetical protein